MVRFISALITVILILGFSIYRHEPPIKIIYPYENITDTFDCDNELNAPIEYFVRGTDRFVVSINSHNQTITHDAEPMIRYYLNIQKYNMTGICTVITHNPNPWPTMIKFKYGYISWWKYFLKELGENPEIFFDHPFSD